jgi:2-dehydro-3-deoxyglucarate aldolase/4-hydroxy-2-oxoheptanedioate aldolase
MGSLAEHIARSGCLLGTIVCSDSAAIAEAVALSGIDWIFFDLEHSPNSLASVQKQIQAVAGRVFTAIRIEAAEAVYVKRALDTGCDAIIVPQVNSAALAKAIVDAGKYAPLGSRSVGIARAHGYGSYFSDTLTQANTKTSIILQIENIQAVKVIDEIISVPGIDGLFIGPYDLSSSMGLIGQVQHADVIKAIDTVRAIAKKSKMPLGIFVGTDAAARQATGDFQFIAVGTDIGRLMQSLKETSQTK